MGEIEYLAHHRRRVVMWLWIGAAVLTFAHVVMQWLMYAHDRAYVFGLSRLFDMDGEANLPTWYSVVLLLCSAAILIRIAMQRDVQVPRMAH